MTHSISQNTKSDPLSDFAGLIRSIWLMTSDFLISNEDAENRAEHWMKLLGEDFFLRYGKYVDYLIKQCCRDRSFRGAIHADEFYRMFCRVVFEKQVYSFGYRQWVTEEQAMEKILQTNARLDAEYRKAVDTVTGRVVDSELRDKVFEKCRAIIYGWEE